MFPVLWVILRRSYGLDVSVFHVQATATSRADAAIGSMAFWKQLVHDVEMFPNDVKRQF